MLPHVSLRTPSINSWASSSSCALLLACSQRARRAASLMMPSFPATETWGGAGSGGIAAQQVRRLCCNQQLDMACHRAILVPRAGTDLVPANQLQSWPDGLGAAKPSSPPSPAGLRTAAHVDDTAAIGHQPFERLAHQSCAAVVGGQRQGAAQVSQALHGGVCTLVQRQPTRSPMAQPPRTHLCPRNLC